MNMTAGERPGPAGRQVGVILAVLLALSPAALAQQRKSFTAVSLGAAQRLVQQAVAEHRDFRRQDKDVYQLAGITRPLAIVLDRDHGDWVLVGERDLGAAILTLDDLAVALRARFLHPTQDPGVTIDPVPCEACRKAGRADQCQHVTTQAVRFFGGVGGTHFGRVCFEADWLMKRISLGLDKLGLDGLQTFFDLVLQERRGTTHGASNVKSRFWFYPIVDRVNVIGDVVLLEKFRMGVFTEVMYAEEDGQPVADLDSFQHGPSEGFARSLSDNYEAAAGVSESLNALRGLTRLAALAKGLVQADGKPDLNYWLKTYPVAAEATPQTTEVLHVESREEALRVSGGVELTALAAKLKGGDATALRELVLQTRPAVGSPTWSFEIAINGGQVAGVSVPDHLADPNRIAALSQHAWFLFQKKRYGDALEAFEAAFANAPEFAAEAQWAKGIVLREYGLVDIPGSAPITQSQHDERLRQAVACFEACVALRPSLAAGHYELGVTLRALGDPQRAVQCLQKAIEADADCAEAYYALGLATAELGDPRGAIGWLGQYLKRQPEGACAADAKAAIERLSLKASARRTLRTYALAGTGLSLRYPDDWVVMTPEEVKRRTKGNMTVAPDCVLFVANPDNFGQNLNLQISRLPGQEEASPQDLEAAAPNLLQLLGRQLQDYHEVSHRVLEVAGVAALELNYSSMAWGKRQRQRTVVLVKHEHAYTLTCTALEADFAEADAHAFSFVVDTLTIQ
jgi:tetratricopeptide (TPR) repeat protein